MILTGCCEILKLSDCCPWDLYEVHVDERKFASEWEKIKNDKNIKDEDKDKIENLIEVINKRSNPKIGLYQYEKGDRPRYDLYEKGDRYIRYDLENFIMGEWKKGWNYLQRMEINWLKPKSGDYIILISILQILITPKFDEIFICSDPYHIDISICKL